MDTPVPPPSHRRRTPERILAAALDHFNRFGEPQVSTHLVAAALRISSGNLHYHFHSKDDLILALFERYDAELRTALPTGLRIDSRATLFDWFDSLFRVHWRHRFLLRDACGLITRHLALEQRLPPLLAEQQTSIAQSLQHLWPQHANTPAIASALHLALVHWVAHAFLQSPRTALEDDHAATVQGALAQHMEGLLPPGEPGRLPCTDSPACSSS